MSQDIEEQLSALMDGELGRDERAFLLRRLEHDAELRAKWTRYHLMRDVMSNRRGSAPMDLSDRVMSAIADEDRAHKPAVRVAGRWRPWAGAALAASVALLAVMAISPRGQMDLGASPMVAETAPAPRLALPADVPGPMVPSVSRDAGVMQPVAAEVRRELPLAPTPMTAEELMLMRHRQIAGANWLVGGDQGLYVAPRQGEQDSYATPASFQPQ